MVVVGEAGDVGGASFGGTASLRRWSALNSGPGRMN